MMSHDLLNPIKVAYGHASFLHRKDPNRSLEDVLAALDRSLEIIEDALAWARTGTAVDETRAVRLPEAGQAFWEVVDHGGQEMVNRCEATIEGNPRRSGLTPPAG